MQITINPEELNTEQRESLAGFILTFPSASAPSVVSNQMSIDFTEPDPMTAFGTPHPDHPSVNLEAPAVHQQITALEAAPNRVSEVGPVLVIPNPPQAAPMVVAPIPTVSTASATAQITVDKTGLPWDARIHSSGKNLNADGTWRSKRGVSATAMAQVEAELKVLMAVPSATVSVPPPPPQNPTVAPPVPQNIPVAIPVASAAVPMSPDNTDLRNQFVALVGRTSAAISAGKLSQDQLQKCCDAVGITSLPQLGIRLDLVPNVASMVDAIIAGQSA